MQTERQLEYKLRIQGPVCSLRNPLYAQPARFAVARLLRPADRSNVPVPRFLQMPHSHGPTRLVIYKNRIHAAGYQIAAHNQNQHIILPHFAQQVRLFKYPAGPDPRRLNLLLLLVAVILSFCVFPRPEFSPPFRNT